MADSPTTAAPLAVRYVPRTALQPAQRNPRRHSDEQIERLCAAITEFGWTTPIIADGEGNVIAGHGRLLAAEKLDMAEVPVINRDDLTPEQQRALVIADNRIAELAEWDADLLRLEMDELLELGVDVELTDFDADELAELFPDRQGDEDPADDEVVEPPVVPRTQPGDVWLLGAHRVACGDSTDADTVAALLGDAKPGLMVTDPPYGVQYDAKWRDVLDDLNRSKGEVANDDRADWSEAYALFPGDVAYVWHPAGATSFVFADSLQATGFEVRMQIIWCKPHFPISRGHYHVQHEPCFYAVRKNATATWAGDRKQSTVWHVDNNLFQGTLGEDDERTGHSTQKPVELMRRPIVNHTRKGDGVYDPFLGSGTTLIAAERTGRVCYGLELSPEYVDVIVTRWQKLTGQQATREGDGARFDDVEPRETPA